MQKVGGLLAGCVWALLRGKERLLVVGEACWAPCMEHLL